MATDGKQYYQKAYEGPTSDGKAKKNINSYFKTH